MKKRCKYCGRKFKEILAVEPKPEKRIVTIASMMSHEMECLKSTSTSNIDTFYGWNTTK